MTATFTKNDTTRCEKVTQEVATLHSARSRPNGDGFATRGPGGLAPSEGSIGLENHGQSFP